jgi:hypothetical protein
MSAYMLWLYAKEDKKLEFIGVIEYLLESNGYCLSILELQLGR